jgi:protein involved in polysaccharide export with SLBB domain
VRRRSRTSVILAAGAALLLTGAARAQVSAPLGGGDGKAPRTADIAAETPGPDRLSSTPIEVPEDYRLDTGDTVSVEVLRHSDATRTLRIPADGMIRLPRLTRPVPARGRTCADLGADLTGRLVTEGKLVLRPGQVSVMVTEMRVRRVYVRGSAGRNGDYDLKNGWRVTELVAVSGGVPNPERVTARLLNPERPAPLVIDLNRVLANPDASDNVMLREGDTLSLDLPKNKRLLIKGEGPRGMHELDERFGLRDALVQLSFSTNGATGALRQATLIRHTVPGDPNSAETRIPVDLYTLLTDESAPDVPVQDLDTLDIPVSERYVFIYGEIAAPRKFFLPEDRPTYLTDIMALGSTSGKAKIDDVKIMRVVAGQRVIKGYQFGKFLSNGDPKNNPEIQPQDIIFIPDVKRPDYVSNVWTAWGLFGIVQALIPGTRLH